MRILQVTHGLPPQSMGGTEMYTYSLSKELSKRHKVFVFHRVNDLHKKEYTLDHYQLDNVDIFTVNNTFRRYESFIDTYNSIHIAEKFPLILEKIRPDVVHIQHLLYLDTGIINEVKKRNIPLFFTLNDYWLICPQGQLLKDNSYPCANRDNYECIDCVSYQLIINKNIFNAHYILKNILPGYFFQLIKKFYLSRSKSLLLSQGMGINLIKERSLHMKNVSSCIDCFIAPSRFIKSKFVESEIPGGKILFLNYGFNLENFKDQLMVSSKRIRFGFIGSFIPAKGVHILIQAFNKIDYKDAELKIYGRAASYKSLLTDYLRYLKRISRNKNIRFMGGFDNMDAAKVFSEIDVLVVPSIWYENSPLVIQEAFAAKTPVIASRIGGIPELIEEGVNGILFEPGNVDDLCSELTSFINNPALIKEIKANIKPPKTIEEHAKEIEGIYKNILNQC